MTAPAKRLGLAGRIARPFIHSKLTPLLLLTSILLGAFAVWKLPREEEPQIVVPMSDINVRMPGASAKEVEQRITTPLERILWEIPGVEYLYSTSSPGLATVIVRFKVGEEEERAAVRIQQKLGAHMDVIPAGASPPLIKMRSIDEGRIFLALRAPRMQSRARSSSGPTASSNWPRERSMSRSIGSPRMKPNDGMVES